MTESTPHRVYEGDCDKCGQPCYSGADGTPMYGIADPGPRHYDCHLKTKTDLEAAIKRLPELEREFRDGIRKLRDAINKR